MFTVKFYSTATEPGSDDWDVVSGVRYQICNKATGAIVTIYPTLISEKGVSFDVGLNSKGFGVAFIENVAGKTVQRVGPFDLPAEAVAA